MKDRAQHLQEKMNLQIAWGQEQEAAFKKIKEALRTATYLSHALEDDTVEYALYTDACKIGFGAALHAILPSDCVVTDSGIPKREERPVAFISRSLNKAEKNYWPTELEMGALVWALRRFQEIIEGHTLTIYTDHSALTWLCQASNSKTGNQRLLLWALELERWKEKTRIVHRAGSTHLNVDTLSRFPVDIETPDDLRRDLNAGDCPEVQKVCSISTLTLSEDFYDLLRKGYSSDRRWHSTVGI